jgi:alpha-D-xyloside xylohydrolase
MLNLRYRLLPYIYSEAWQVTSKGSTMMRPLVMDFRGDSDAVKQPFEYMFGKSVLVAPVVEPGAEYWDVYLPESTDWYDFWTGERYTGGRTVNKAIPIDIIPLYVRAGTILPVGPEVQYATEKRWDNLEIRVYEGASGVFTLYEDENDNYNYEKGVYSTITFTWNDIKKTLTINERQGSFPGMIAERRFNIIRVAENRGTGTEAVENFDKEITYKGRKMRIKF